MTAMQIIVDELLTRYQLAGKGKLVVLLHGWGDNATGLAGLQTALAEHFTVLAVDLPGFGATQAPHETWDLDNYTTFVQHLLQKLRLDQPYAVIGHSNGGAIAIRGIALGELQPEKLVLLAAAGIRTSQKSRRLALKVVAKAGNVATLWMPERQRRNLRESLYGVAGSDMLVAPQLQETFKRTVRQDVQADAAKLKLPTLLIYAEDDQAVPPADGRRYQQLIAGSQLAVVPDAGHFVHLDQAAEVVSLITEFLS